MLNLEVFDLRPLKFLLLNPHSRFDIHYSRFLTTILIQDSLFAISYYNPFLILNIEYPFVAIGIFA